MNIATWNVNSLKVRLPQVLEWLQMQPVDVLCVQETKLQDEHFPAEAIAEAGWQVLYHGQKTYNGVALLARAGLADVQRNLPGFDDPQARVIAATVDGTRIICCYVPNGQALDSDKYVYKLQWFEQLQAFVKAELARHEKLVVCGDFNIVPRVQDSYDADKWEGDIFCSVPERAALQGLLDLGLTDCWTQFEHGEAEERERFTWWDYRAAGFRRNLGLRIDLVLASKAFSCTSCAVDLVPRRWERPSDHAPVLACLEPTK